METTRRRFLTASAAAAIAGGADLLASAPAHAAVNCAPPSAQQLAFSTSVASTAAGQEVTASAAFGVIGVDGLPVEISMSRVDIWWDLDQSQWWSIFSGQPVSVSGQPPQRVASIASIGECAFSGPFTVPDVEPGSYAVVPIAYDVLGDCFSYWPAYVAVG